MSVFLLKKQQNKKTKNSKENTLNRDLFIVICIIVIISFTISCNVWKYNIRNNIELISNTHKKYERMEWRLVESFRLLKNAETWLLIYPVKRLQSLSD